MEQISQKAGELFPGVLMTALVAMAAQFVSDHYGAPVMLMAILLGIPFQFLSSEPRTAAGIQFASRFILRVGVALLGVRISLDLLTGIGLHFALWIAAGVALTIAAGLIAAPVMGRDRAFGFLTGGAVAICGASAALAISSLLPKGDTKERDLSFTVVSVTVASTVAMILYPILLGATGWTDREIGIFLGATIHDVAQVVGAGFSVSEEAGDVSTLVKLFRVTLLAPVVFVGALVMRNASGTGARPPLIPGFVVGFIALALANSFGVVPDALKGGIDAASRVCLVMAVAAVGMKTSVQELRDVGGTAVAMIVGLTVFLAVFIWAGVILLT